MRGFTSLTAAAFAMTVALVLSISPLLVDDSDKTINVDKVPVYKSLRGANEDNTNVAEVQAAADEEAAAPEAANGPKNAPEAGAEEEPAEKGTQAPKEQADALLEEANNEQAAHETDKTEVAKVAQAEAIEADAAVNEIHTANTTENAQPTAAGVVQVVGLDFNTTQDAIDEAFRILGLSTCLKQRDVLLGVTEKVSGCWMLDGVGFVSAEDAPILNKAGQQIQQMNNTAQLVPENIVLPIFFIGKVWGHLNDWRLFAEEAVCKKYGFEYSDAGEIVIAVRKAAMSNNVCAWLGRGEVVVLKPPELRNGDIGTHTSWSPDKQGLKPTKVVQSQCK